MAGRRAAQTTVPMLESHHDTRKEARCAEARDIENDDRDEDRRR